VRGNSNVARSSTGTREGPEAASSPFVPSSSDCDCDAVEAVEVDAKLSVECECAGERRASQLLDPLPRSRKRRPGLPLGVPAARPAQRVVHAEPQLATPLVVCNCS